MEQTAVKWFADRIKHGGLVSKKQFDELCEQAEGMFEQQIINANTVGQGENPIFPNQEAEQYYNKTFKSE